MKPIFKIKTEKVNENVKYAPFRFIFYARLSGILSENGSFYNPVATLDVLEALL